MRSIDLNDKTDGIEKIIEFFKFLCVEYEYLSNDIPSTAGFNRQIDFIVFGKSYRIIWYKNSSTLLLNPEDVINSPRIPFKYMWLDNTYPLVGGNLSLGFSSSIPFEYENLRIPLPRK